MTAGRRDDDGVRAAVPARSAGRERGAADGDCDAGQKPDDAHSQRIDQGGRRSQREREGEGRSSRVRPFEHFREGEPNGRGGGQGDGTREPGFEARGQHAAVRVATGADPRQGREAHEEAHRGRQGGRDEGFVEGAAGCVRVSEGRRVGDQRGKQAEEDCPRNPARIHHRYLSTPAQGLAWNRVVHLRPLPLAEPGAGVNGGTPPRRKHAQRTVDSIMSSHMSVENADTVSLVCALLVRFPELASIRSAPADRTVRLTFAVKLRPERLAQAALTEAVEDHVAGFLMLAKEKPETLRLEFEGDRTTSFVHVTRDLESFTKEELELLVGLFSQRFGDALVRNPLPDTHLDDDPAAQDEAASYAVEALRDPAQSKSLVGFREEKRVLVYFLKSQKKAKASARR